MSNTWAAFDVGATLGGARSANLSARSPIEACRTDKFEMRPHSVLKYPPLQPPVPIKRLRFSGGIGPAICYAVSYAQFHYLQLISHWYHVHPVAFIGSKSKPLP